MDNYLIEKKETKASDENFQKRIKAYARFMSAMNSKNVTPYNVSKNTGIATSTLSDWKNGKSMPKQDKMKQIADYLCVDVEYLVTGNKKEISDEDALLDVRVSEDFELKEAIKKYYSLDDRKKKHVIELINLLSED